MKILKNVSDLHTPVSYCSFINSSADGGPHSRCEVATRDVLHHEVKATRLVVVEVIVNCRNTWMFKGRKEQRFPFKISDGLLVLVRIEMRLHHLFDGARSITKVSILRQVNC